MFPIKTFYLKAVDKINVLVTFTLAIFLSVMVVVIFSQVFSRYVLERSISWSEELSRYLMIWGVFLGVAYAVRKNLLIAVMLLPEFLPLKFQKIIYMSVHVLIIAFSALLVYYGGVMVSKVLHQTSPALEISVAIPYAAIPVGGLLMLLNAIAAMIDKPEKEEGRE